jgi:hypothetical protein
MYQYRDTRNLVQFVHQAAERIRREGQAAIEYFSDHRSQYLTPDYYLYVYDQNGRNLFHAGMPELEEQDLWQAEDKDGRPIMGLILEALADPFNPHGWVHYLWWEPGQFYAVPKSSCHFEIELTDGRELVVGGGLTYPNEEKEFVRIIVDSAAALLRTKGLDGLETIGDPLSRFSFRDVRVFAFDPDGNTLLSPVVGSVSQSGLLEFVDAAGHRPFAVAVKGLAKSESVWQVFMARNRYRRDLVKKALYVRGVALPERTLYLAAITDLPQPPY